jgi:hypothetical protein
MKNNFNDRFVSEKVMKNRHRKNKISIQIHGKLEYKIAESNGKCGL